MASEEDDAMEIVEPAKSRLPLALGAVSLLLLGGGIGYASTFLLGSGPAAASQGDPDAPEQAPPDDLEHRAVKSLGLFTVNLRGTGGGRVLRMEVQVEADEDALPALDDRMPQLRDATITLVSDYSWSDIEGLDGKTRLRDELLGRMNALLGPERISRVYFTQFVVQ